MSGTHGATGPEQRLAERYGQTRGTPLGQRAAAAGLALALAAAAAWWIWVAVVRSDPGVTWQLIGFGTVTDTSVEVRWFVDRDPAIRVDCVLRARDESGAEVGRDRVPIPTGGEDNVEVRATVKTAGRPVTGEVLSCLEVAGR